VNARTGIEPAATTAVEPAGMIMPPNRRFINVSPLNKRRWENFKANRRGYWSLWIFLAMFLISLFAEFIANDKPIFVHVNGKSFFPAVMTYPDTVFGKPDDKNLFGTAADYRDDYLMGLIVKEGGTIVWPPVRFSYNTQVSRPPSPFPSKPTWLLNQKDCDFAAKNGFAKCDELEYNWLGTDDGGRDVVARLIYGFRISVLFGLALTIISSVIGVAAGAVQGYFGGWVDLLFQRFIEIWTSVPEL
jgi:microcin C transport system permease protein